MKIMTYLIGAYAGMAYLFYSHNDGDLHRAAIWPYTAYLAVNEEGPNSTVIALREEIKRLKKQLENKPDEPTQRPAPGMFE